MLAEVLDFIINGHLQGQVHMAWIPLAVAGAGMLYGAYQGEQQRAAAERRDKMNAELAALDTAYSPFVARTGYKATSTDRGPGMIGGGFQGAMAGYQTGAGIQQGMNRNNMYEQLLQDMKSQRAAQAVYGGQRPSGSQQTAWSQLGSQWGQG